MATSSKSEGGPPPAATRPAPDVPPTPSTSDTDLLLTYSDNPPRYSSIDPAWDVLQGEASTGQTAATTPPHPPSVGPVPVVVCHPPSTHTPPLNPNSRWWSWVPGPAQYFPPGLEHMTDATELTIKKKGRTYRVIHNEHQIYIVRRKKDGFGGVNIKILNNANLEVLILNRTLEAARCCSSTTHLEVMFPPGNMVGVVQGNKSEFSVHNPSGDLVFLLEVEPVGCCRKADYQVVTKERFTIGRLTHQKTSMIRGRKGMAVTFPANMEIRNKALVLAAALSIRDRHW
ncbi:uncharacterized protein LOC121867478 [Homarus americanus]|uniref:Phospholipid scramblase n=1 Tax=Homarus americanus TaxID=6706 RepID=A0A8J5K0Y3_HOMAM|nr:uncharacterized protein LOC121867478 [Homarus americanus]KAG7168152.1 Phospholipid scramblase 2-like 1 [Homarus americanus]